MNQHPQVPEANHQPGHEPDATSEAAAMRDR